MKKIAEKPDMLSWGKEERERLTLVLSWLRNAAKEKNAPEGIREIAEIAGAAKKWYDIASNGTWETMTLEERRKMHDSIYARALAENYETSILNPAVCTRWYGKTYAQVISILCEEIIQSVPYLLRGIRKPFLYACELAAEVFGLIEKDGISRSIRQSLYYYTHDYCREFLTFRMYEKGDAGCTKEIETLIRSAAESEAGLYGYGMPISEGTLEVHRFLAKQSQETIDSMAKTFVNGFIDSFDTMRIDRTKKKTVQFDVFFGFERVTARAIDFFREEGLEPRLFLQNCMMVYQCAFVAGGMAGMSVNRQRGYDHRNDYMCVLQRNLMEVVLESMKEIYDNGGNRWRENAGVACQEAFGIPEIDFVNKPAVPTAKGRMAGYIQELHGRLIQLSAKYAPLEERTFTIIAYPVPAIGDNFEEIFHETIRCNNLPNAKYKEIQQRLIDVLDRGAYVTVTGCGVNETNMKVMLHTLENPATQTNFENCGADVNIPVGEVFTSPVLKGTEGTLHVTKVSIDCTTYKNLRLQFKDGMITSCSCENFPTEAENATFLNETILFQHDTLPIGEFAIGTNTVAYAMGIRCNCQEQLPILIAEKTGPHFAVGDTCYSHSEEHKVYNPNGKEIIARENEVSALRSEDPAKAYMNCHTDITIPYDELGEILVHAADGTVIGAIIRDGRFVVPGTEELNKPLEELEAAGK
ncbi:MAG: aminopeptidase [Lachnospiraceae bacterium]|nr:aminopeptidase [Lachnospiraceae bacterium]